MHQTPPPFKFTEFAVKIAIKYLNALNSFHILLPDISLYQLKMFALELGK